ncbi:heme lyase CcmF/NrfE family subunit [Hyphomonas sp. FCG-A18]|uniref:heme lyase CcmF/NrfE family subunit n=1 Tax=Hyphomonas sp. FCG-A18 TaxID=3080019 RepID=UPI002B2B77D2|nr:heme lyase CcmF/NrfE family subunit [Hyphomonas sp. FCG-A18]
MIELGHFLAFLAMTVSGGLAYAGLRGQRAMAGKLAIAGFVLMAISFLILIRSFLISDFSVQLVAINSHTEKPLIYKFAGTWGNHEGSMALWCLVMFGFAAAGAWIMRTGRDVFEARTLGLQGLLTLGAMAYLLFASSPYIRLDNPPLQGSDLNPLLQDPALAAHPPMLYLGYVGYSFVFALAAAGLMEGRIDRQWAKTARLWAMAAFVPLTAGIALGSYWAYYELGWGGWWFWDPVENASLMPWLVGAAFLHSVVVTEKRDSFRAWTVLLAVMAFCFSILGAFLVRSGLLTSVHAFAVDPERGTLLLIGLLAYGGFALTLFAIRAPSLKGGAEHMLISREGALMGNNLVFAVATLTVLLGTMFPLIAEAAGEVMSVGEPYFNLTFTPIMALALITLPVVQAWAWGKADLRNLWKWAAAFIGIVAVFWLIGVGPLEISLLAGFGFGLGVWLIGGAAWEIWRRAKTLQRLPKLPGRVWGMTLTHAGLGVFILGAVGETSLRQHQTLALEEGQSLRMAGWTITLDDVQAVEGPNWYADRAFLTATRGGTTASLSPEKRIYPAARMPTTETAIYSSGLSDLYVALGESRRADGVTRWTFEVFKKPLVDLIYWGVILMSIGGLLCFMPGRKSAKRET